MTHIIFYGDSLRLLIHFLSKGIWIIKVFIGVMDVIPNEYLLRVTGIILKNKGVAQRQYTPKFWSECFRVREGYR